MSHAAIAGFPTHIELLIQLGERDGRPADEMLFDFEAA
jgi:hypothetical protein